MQLQDKHFIVTGAGSGIGQQLTLQLLQKGAHVAGFDINEEGLNDTASQAGEYETTFTQHSVNIADAAAVHTGVQEAMQAHGGVIDGVINNAGIIQPFVRVNELEMSAIERVMNVNFYGTLHMIKSVLPQLLERPEAYVVNVSSMGGFLPVPGQSVYGASKAAVKLLTEGLWAELQDTNVHVTVVFPGATDTNITKNSGVDSPMSEEEAAQSSFPTTSAADAAATIIAGMQKNKPRVFIGKDSKLMNALYRLAPVRATKLIASQMKSLLK